MDGGMVSGICINWEEQTIILVPNAAPEKPLAFGLPGGMIGRGETPEEAMVREWKEEVWGCGTPQVKPLMKIKRGGEISPHYQHLFLIEDTGRETRRGGVKGETKAPVRVSLWAIARGEVEVFHSHKLALLSYLESEAPKVKLAAFLFIDMDRNMKK